MGRKDSMAKLGLVLTNGVLSYKGAGGPVAGAKASVETAGDIERRITATRLLLTGPFALAFRKKKDHRSLYLTVEGQGFSFLVELKPDQEVLARTVAGQINSQAGGGQQAPSSPPPGWYPAPDGSDVDEWWNGGRWTGQKRF